VKRDKNYADEEKKINLKKIISKGRNFKKR
jgi:hypothetical protein